MLLAVKNPHAPEGDMSRGFYLWVAKIPWKRKWQSTSIFLPGEYHGQKSLERYSPWGHKESEMTEAT